MHKALDAKRKSAMRFEQLNQIVDDIAPSLPTPAHVAVLFCCYRHARELGHFQVSTNRIAQSTKVSPRHARRIIDDLEQWKVIEMEREHNGPIPRQYRITGNRAIGTPMSPLDEKDHPI